MWQWRMEGSQVSTSSLVSGGEAMLVAEIIKLGLREGLEDLPSPEGPLLPGFPFKILGFYFPPPVLLPVPLPVPLPVCPSAGLRASSDWSSRGFLMRSTYRFSADSDSCRGASTELTPRRLGGSLVLVTECRKSPAWIWSSPAGRCYF